VGLSAVISYLVSQILFSVLIMDKMSRITEKIVTGEIKETQNLPWLQNFIYLVKQEIPRATIPVLLTLFLTLAGWLTPFGPIVTIIATGLAMVRRMVEFKKRFNLMSSALLFHLGFGILFLIPGLNILFLSFAPVGATLYFIENHDAPKMS
jgi:CysZ protein